MRILLVTFYYAPDGGPDPPLMADLAQGFLARGHAVTVLTTIPHYQRTGPDPRWRGRLLAIEHAGPRHRILRGRVYVPRTGSLWRRALNYASFLATGLLGLAAAGRHELIYVYAPPPSTGLLGALASVLWGAPLIYNVQDIYPDIALEIGVLRAGLLARLLGGFERLMYRIAARVAVISEGARTNLAAKGVPAAKLCCIPNWVDAGEIAPRPKDGPWRRAHGLEDRFVVLYAGNLGLSQGLERVLAAAERWRAQTDVQLLLVGRGAARAALAARARALGLANLRFCDPVPRADLPDLLAAADVSLVLLRPAVSVASVPSKLHAIMASARPVLCVAAPASDAWQLVEQAGAGLCVHPDDERGFDRALERLRSEAALAARLGANGRRYVLEHRGREQALARWADLAEALVPGATPTGASAACAR